jgi:DNA-binding IclR family transcriptional regulator
VDLMSAPAPLSRAWSLMQALAGHAFEGRRLKELADTVQQSAPTTLRDLEALEHIGLAERIPGRPDNWRLTARIVQLAHAHQHEMARLRDRLEGLDRSYTRTPN